MRRVLVVGGAGYIGAHVAQVLCGNGYQVRIYDDFSNGLERRVRDRFSDIVRADVLDRDSLLAAMDGVESVIHLAAKKSVEESMVNPLKYYENNVGGTLNVLAAMTARNVKRIVFSSTAAVYGFSDKGQIEECDPIKPYSPYGATKLISEELIRSVGKAEKLSTVSLRYFNVVGSTQDAFGDNSRDNLVPKVFASVRQNRQPEIYGTDYPTKDGTCIRDYIHVGDLAEAHLTALKSIESRDIHEVYNVGSGTGYSVLEMMNQISSTMNSQLSPIKAGRRAGDTPQLIASTKKIEKELGWKPRFTLKEMIDSAWKAELGNS